MQKPKTVAQKLFAAVFPFNKKGATMQIQGETSVNKLIVLFVFDKMESALSERTILEMCTAGNNWLNYMDCKELLPRLLEDGFICRISSITLRSPL